MRLDKYSVLKLLLTLCLLDALSVWLLILFYLTGIDVMFLVNVNFVIILLVLSVFFLTSVHFPSISVIFWVLIFISLIKSLIYVSGEQDFGFKFLFSHAFSLLMPIMALNFTAEFRYSDYCNVRRYFKKFAIVYSVIAIGGLVVYGFFYAIGKIAYFGMGSNLHYVFPFFLDANKLRNTIFFFLAIVLTGKRAVLLNFIVQNFAHYSSYLSKRPGYLIMFIAVSAGSIVGIYQYTDILSRFDVFFELDFTNSRSMLLAFSGRMEEIVGIWDYYMAHPNQLFFGAPAGASYIWVVESSNYVEAKNYAHVTFFAYLYRYGLVFAVALYLMFAILLLRRWRPTEPFFLAVLGCVTSSMFGANMLVDPMGWLLLGMLFHICPPRGKLNRPRTNPQDVHLGN